MRARGFLIHSSPEAQEQLNAETEPRMESLGIRDLSSWLWSSIDNDDSRDLDQIEYAKKEANGTRIYIGVADVDWFVPKASALDRAAAQNTTSVYTGVETFPMLPLRLSTDLSSLNEGVKRLAIVIEMLVTDDGAAAESSVYPAIVQNKAQLTYNAVAEWLEAQGNSLPAVERSDAARSEAGAATLRKIEQNKDLQTQLRMQDETAQRLRERRHESGALTLQTTELKPIMSADGAVIDLEARRQNRASVLIEDFMIAANEVTSRFLEARRLPSIRRVVQNPERWDRIVALAAALGGKLSPEPDSKSLEEFLKHQQRDNPAHFEDLSLAVIKLLGRGEYTLKLPGEDAPGHFGLAVRNYSHSTAPNRRYPDLLTQRLLKAAFAGKASPYSTDELGALARHCTDKENDANKVERLVKKCAAATILISHIGEKFAAVVSGVTAAGTWVRLSQPPVEGKLIHVPGRLDVGHKLQVRLTFVDPEKGFIDFEPA
jgi:exoribonuclease-2